MSRPEDLASDNDNDKIKNNKMDGRQTQLRIAKTLGQQVWPLVDTSPDIVQRKQRVVMAISAMVAGKVVTIQVRYIFKHMVDSLPLATSPSATVVADAASIMDPIIVLHKGVSFQGIVVDSKHDCSGWWQSASSFWFFPSNRKSILLKFGSECHCFDSSIVESFKY